MTGRGAQTRRRFRRVERSGAKPSMADRAQVDGKARVFHSNEDIVSLIRSLLGHDLGLVGVGGGDVREGVELGVPGEERGELLLGVEARRHTVRVYALG